MGIAIRPSWQTHPIAAMQRSDWFGLAAVLALAIALRLTFYTGVFGSDDVNYVETAAKIASGDWQASNYIGAIRYGMNLPVALSIYLFGLSEASANLWPFLCSIGEVVIVFFVARSLWSPRAAILSAGLLALLPLHVHFSGRVMADPPLGFFLTLSIALLLLAAHSKRPLTYFAAGLAWGGVFWVKESVGLLFLPVFLLLSIVVRSVGGRWISLFAGMGVAVAANCALMSLVADNAMHVFSVIKGGMATYGDFEVRTSPWFYLRFLLVDIRHTFLLGLLAAAGVAFCARDALRGNNTGSGIQFVVLWVLFLIGMFSFAVVSFSPAKLVMKQVNYMLIFVGPMALLAGWFLASLPNSVFLPLSVVIVCGSVILAALEQQAIQVFTANSRAAYGFLRDHPNASLVGTTNNYWVIKFLSIIENRPELRDRFSRFGDIASLGKSSFLDTRSGDKVGKEVFALAFARNLKWGHDKSSGILLLSDVPKCWTSAGMLAPAALGSGRWIVKGLVAAGAWLPEYLRPRYLSALQPVSTPETAHLFKVDRLCLTTQG